MVKRRLKIAIALLFILLSTTSCKGFISEEQNNQPQIAQMRSICELATMECYYRNVAKFDEKDVSGFLLWKKDKKFWIEYSGIVKIGIDASQVLLEVDDTAVTITIPEAKVLDYKVDENSLNPDAYIVAKKSAKITGEDETKAFNEAQNHMKLTASNDLTLLLNAQQHAQSLIEGYVNNIGEAIGKNYNIKWVYVDDKAVEESKEGN